jgi:ADP-ribose pyrophosphatase YjhB (NUDIX family)
MLYDWLKVCVSVFLNVLNKLTGGKMPPLGSACAIVEKDGLFLVVALPRERIVFPGGFMTWYEQPSQTAEREGREETGLRLRARELLNFYARPSAKLTQLSTIRFIFIAEVLGGELRNNIEGRPLWLSESELRQRMDEDDVDILDAYLRSRQQPATSAYNSSHKD